MQRLLSVEGLERFLHVHVLLLGCRRQRCTHGSGLESASGVRVKVRVRVRVRVKDTYAATPRAWLGSELGLVKRAQQLLVRG